MTYKYAQLNIQDAHQSNKAGEIFIQSGDSAEESDLFVLLEIDSNQPADKQFIKQFLETVFAAYENTKIFEPEKGLEKILHELNVSLIQFFPNKNYHNLLHCFVGLYHNGSLHFSIRNKINAYLIAPNITKKINTEHEEVDEETDKIFNYTLNGNIKDNEKILITCESLTDYIALDKIKKTVAALPPASSVAHFTNILEASPPHTSFLSIILTAPQTQPITEKSAMTSGSRLTPQISKTSLDQLLLTQQKTQAILTKPSLIKNLTAKVINKTIRPIIGRNQNGRGKQSPLFTILNGLRKRITRFWQLIFFTETRNQSIKSLTKKLTAYLGKINKLSKFNKALLIITVILLFLFSQNLIWQSQKKAQLQDNQKYLDTVQTIEEKQHSIEASLIYNDTPRSKQLLQEISEILLNLPQDSQERIAKHQELSKNTNKLYEQVWKVVNIAEPTVLFDFKEINPGAQIFEFAIKDNFIYGINSTKQLFLYNIASGEKQVKDDADYSLKNLSLTPQNLLIGHSPDKRFFSLDASGQKEITISAIDAATQIDGLAFYLDKMYMVDKNAKQIYRFTYSQGGYSAKVNWIKEDLPVDKIVSVTVDGFVYGLQENGEILKLGGGRKQEYPKIVVEPELLSPTKIFTTAGSAYLYILDPANKRLAIINKEKAELEKQYFSEKFSNLKDMQVNETQKKAYLLNGSQVVVIGL